MRILNLLSTAAIVGLMACSQAGDNADSNGSSADGADMTHNTLPVTATHAFETQLKPIQSVAFSPNDVASWLGALALLDTQGRLYTTNIEGGSQNALGASRYVDIIGLSRTKAPAIFLALDEAGSVKAFIESDDNGNFSPLTVISGAPKISQFCRGPSAETDSLTVITEAGNLAKIAISVENDSALSLGGEQMAKVKALSAVSSCAHDDRNNIYAAVQSRGGLRLGKISGSTLSEGPTLTTDSEGGITLAYIGSDKDGGYIAVQSDGARGPSLYDAATLEPITDLRIDSGLSINGLGNGRSIFSTQSSFGGSAFDAGVVLIPDTGSNRMVVLSRSYLIEQIANHQP